MAKPILTELEQSNPAVLTGSVKIAPERYRPQIEFTWKVKDFRVTAIEPRDAFERMSRLARARLFNNILRKVRERSSHPQIRSAALILTRKGDIFVASNTQLQHEYHRDCAEINISNITHQLRQRGDEVAEVYFAMAPKELAPKRQKYRIFAPCGKCVDMFCRNFPPSTRITMMPPGSHTFTINDTAKDLQSVGPGEAWETTLEQLNQHWEIKLAGAARTYGEQGLRALEGGKIPQAKFSAGQVDRLLHSTPRQWAQRVKSNSPLMQRVKLAIRNEFTERVSIAQLDILEPEKQLEGISRYMVQRIDEAYRRRKKLLAEGETPGLDTIRCAVIRLSDGTYHQVTEVDGRNENAVTHAEITAVNKAQDKNNEVTDVWVMTMNRQDIENGVMHTSFKEAVERSNKRGTKDHETGERRVHFHYIPFNDGKRTQEELEAVTRHFAEARELFPSQWPGYKFLEEARRAQVSGAGK